MEIILPAVLAALIPLLVMKADKNVKFVEWLSPVVTCYLLGILLGNIPNLPWSKALARTLSEGSVLFAIPLFLYAVDLPGWLKLAKKTIGSFLILVLSVIIVSSLAGFLFRSYDSEVWKMSGMLAGVYIGGTANLTAIGKMLEIRDEAFITLNAIDLVLGGFYLLFVMSLGVKILSKILPPFDHSDIQDDLLPDHSNWSQLPIGKRIIHSLVLIGFTSISIGVTLWLSHVFTGGESAGFIILSLTLIAVGLSFIPKVRHFEGSQEWGQYFLLMFCTAVGSLADISQLLTGKLWYFAFCAVIMFGSIALHFLCCFFLKIDRDTAIITSMAGIFGPAFIPAMSSVLKNRAVLVSGITTGLVGIAVGNFAGLFVAWLLK